MLDIGLLDVKIPSDVFKYAEGNRVTLNCEIPLDIVLILTGNIGLNTVTVKYFK